MKKFSRDEEQDIRMMYRDAKHPEAQIGVMAQLYACDKADIRRVLGLPCNAPPKAATLHEKAPDRQNTPPTRYSLEFKRGAANMVLDGGIMQKDAAEMLGISRTTICCWVAQEQERRAAGEPIFEPEPPPIQIPESIQIPPQKPAPEPPPPAKQKTIRFIMKSGATFDIRCRDFAVKKSADGKFNHYEFMQPESRPPHYICRYEVAAILEV